MPAGAQATSYLPGEDPGTAKANAEYQMALQRMLESLDYRKNQMFDPTLLAMAEGFLKPAPTFGESLGNVAGSLRAAQEKKAIEEQKYAEARLGLAGKGLELERQKARERAFQQLGGMGAPAAEEAPAGTPGAIPGGASGQAPAPVGAGQVAQGVAQAGAGRLAAPMPSLTRQQFMALQASEGAISPAQAESNWAEYQKRLAETQGQIATAQRALSDMSEREIYGSTYRVPIQIARQLDDALVSNDAARYKAVADQFLRGTGQPPRSVAASEIEKAGALEREKVLQTESAKLEANVPVMLDTALQIRAATGRIMQHAANAPEVFGVFEKPTIVAALGRLIDEGLTVGATRVNLGGFRPAMTQALLAMSPDQQNAIPGKTTEDKLNSLMLFAGDKAELELLYRRKYLSGQGQGAISNMEQAMIPAMIGSEKDSPKVIQDKARLMSLRAQFDIKEARKWKEMSRANPKLTYLQFRNSDEWEKMRDEYEQVLQREFNRYTPRDETSGSSAARPTAAPTTPSAAAPASVPGPSQVIPGPRIRRDEALPMPSGSAIPNAVRRLDSMFPLR